MSDQRVRGNLPNTSTAIVVPFRGSVGRYVAIHQYEGALEDRYLVVLVEADGRWSERSDYLEDRDQAGELALALADRLGLRLEPYALRAGTWLVGGAA